MTPEPPESEIERHFPNLRVNDYKVTSPETPAYNCIAWAAEDQDSFWWPDKEGVGFWPDGVRRTETAEAFIEAFRTLGYETCSGPDLEPEYRKVAIFFHRLLDKPTHAARQCADGSWTSKLGDAQDIEHRSLKAVSGTIYGDPKVFLRRPIRRDSERRVLAEAPSVPIRLKVGRREPARTSKPGKGKRRSGP